MPLADLGLLLLALLGHCATLLAYANYVNSCRLRLRPIVLLSRAGQATLLLAVAMLLFWQTSAGGEARLLGPISGPWHVIVWGYVLVFAPIGLGAILAWLRRYVRRSPTALLESRTTEHDLTGRLGEISFTGDWQNRLLTKLPGNEVYRLEVAEKTLLIPRLPPRLDGLVIAHVSDLHLGCGMDRRFFEESLRLVSDMRADMLVLTGDLLDDVACLEWIEPLLGPLEPRYGSYAILGNHDWLLGVAEPLQERLEAAGVKYLGGRWQQVLVEGEMLLLAGNEAPWFPAADMSGAPRPASEGGPVRILAAHSPDQIPWAQRHGFDLLLAGHTHGGQVVLPGLGPTFTASRYQGRWVSGVYHEAPTVAHVIRGLAGDTPLRYRCLPEIARLTLRVPLAVEDAATEAALSAAMVQP